MRCVVPSELVPKERLKDRIACHHPDQRHPKRNQRAWASTITRQSKKRAPGGGGGKEPDNNGSTTLTTIHNNITPRHEPTSTCTIRHEKGDEPTERLCGCETIHTHTHTQTTRPGAGGGRRVIRFSNGSARGTAEYSGVREERKEGRGWGEGAGGRGGGDVLPCRCAGLPFVHPHLGFLVRWVRDHFCRYVALQRGRGRRCVCVGVSSCAWGRLREK